MTASPWSTDEEKKNFKKQTKQSKLAEIDSIYKHLTKTASFMTLVKTPLLRRLIIVCQKGKSTERNFLPFEKRL